MPDDQVLLRSKFYKGSRGETREVRYFGKRILWDEEVFIWPFMHREVFIPPWYRFSAPWDCKALVKEGPKAMVLYKK